MHLPAEHTRVVKEALAASPPLSPELAKTRLDAAEQPLPGPGETLLTPWLEPLLTLTFEALRQRENKLGH